MIINKDLRIGNWIRVFGVDSPCIAVDVLCDSVNTLTHEGVPYDEIEGIELTEDILLGCGFMKDQSQFLLSVSIKYYFGQIAFNKDLSKTYVFNNYINQVIEIPTITHFHHLQNILLDLGTDLPTTGFKTLK